MTEVAENPVVITETPASHLSDNPKIVDAIQTHLDAFNDEESPAVEIPEVKETPTEIPTETSVEKPTEEIPSVEKVEEKPIEEAVAALAESTLPAAYVRTAKSRGWTDEEIAQFRTASPDLAMKTFERMHQSRTQEINEWAELGRKNRQGNAPTPSVAVPAPTSAPSLQPINVQEMVERFGNQELIEALAGPINAQIAVLAPLVEGATRAQAQAKQTQQEILGKTVEDFFTAKDMVPFAEHYGKIATITQSQVEVRAKVLETADALISGAAYQGRKLSVEDALTLAHDSVASGLKETIIRDKIRKDVKTREASITLKPTAQGRATAGGPPKDRAELVSRTEDRLAKAFG